MMPEMDGQEVLKKIRQYEEENDITPMEGVNVVMTTALGDYSNIEEAFLGQCEGYLVKPIDRQKLEKILQGLKITKKEI